jgi:tetratricopeptide (TPR) repeat protein
MIITKIGKIRQNSIRLVPCSFLICLAILTACAPHPKLTPELYTTLADSALQQGHQDSASDLYKKAIKANPKNFVALKKLCHLYLNQKKYDDIIESTAKIKPNSDTADVIRVRAIALDLKGQHQTAQTLYQDLLTLNPDDVKSQKNLELSKQLSMPLV